MFMSEGIDGLSQLDRSKTLKTLNVRPLTGECSPEFFKSVILGFLSAFTIGVTASCRLSFLRFPS